MARVFLAALALLAMPLAAMLAGCGLQPLYAGGGNGATARTLQGIEVAPIEGRAGWLMRNALTDRLGIVGGAGDAPRFRLVVVLDDRLEGLGLLNNNTIGRERRTLRARYQLVDIGSGAIVIDATAGSDAGIDVASSEYATVAAEATALQNLTSEVANRIILRLALQPRVGSDNRARPTPNTP